MIDRRGFLKLLGLTTLAGMTPGMLEALGDAQGIPIPGEILDRLPRPLIIPVSGPIIHTVDWEALNLVTREMMPILADNLFRESPIITFLAKKQRRKYAIISDVKGARWER